MPGPIPNRSTNLSRERDANRGNDRPLLKKGTLRSVEIPDPDPEWHSTAKMFYMSFMSSGQADFFQDTDWAYIWNLCEEMSDYKRTSRKSAQMFDSLLKGMNNTLATESDRRRIRIELEEPEVQDDAEIVAISDYKAQLGVAQ